MYPIVQIVLGVFFLTMDFHPSLLLGTNLLPVFLLLRSPGPVIGKAPFHGPLDNLVEVQG
jgi:hypothetical protein